MQCWPSLPRLLAQMSAPTPVPAPTCIVGLLLHQGLQCNAKQFNGLYLPARLLLHLHLRATTQGYFYVEAYKGAHVKEALRGLRMIYASKPPKLVPIKEMVDAVTVAKTAAKPLGASFRGAGVWDYGRL